jgi:hypothetical protein
MPFLRPVNLPAPLIAQSVASVGLGLYLAFSRRAPFGLFAPANPSPRTADTISLLGTIVTALEINYLVASYMPFEDNQWIASSVPVRLGVSALLGTLCLVHRKRMTSDAFWEFFALAIADGGAAIILGLQIGRFDGMVSGAEKWL